MIISDLDNDGILETPSEILQEKHFYPFGMAMEGPWMQSGGNNKYQYNGKELNEEFGLNLMDYGARWYDAAVGRWWSVDPLAEDFQDLSPYNYVENSPVLFIDPDGTTVDVTNMLYSVEGLHALYNIINDLSSQTGLDINIVKNSDGNFILNENGCGGEVRSESEAAYVSHLINNQSGTINMSDVTGVINNVSEPEDGGGQEYGTHAYADGRMNINTNQIDNFINGTDLAGLGKEVMGYGMVFLHESLHTSFGASYYKKSGRFLDPPKKQRSTKAGETVSIVNNFRNELGLAKRKVYGMFGGFHFMKVVFTKNGKDYNAAYVEGDKNDLRRKRESTSSEMRKKLPN